MNLTKLIGGFNFKKFSKASRTDLGVLKVAFMVAALDGEVTDAEYRALEALAFSGAGVPAGLRQFRIASQVRRPCSAEFRHACRETDCAVWRRGGRGERAEEAGRGKLRWT